MPKAHPGNPWEKTLTHPEGEAELEVVRLWELIGQPSGDMSVDGFVP